MSEVPLYLEAVELDEAIAGRIAHQPHELLHTDAFILLVKIVIRSECITAHPGAFREKGHASSKSLSGLC